MTLRGILRRTPACWFALLAVASYWLFGPSRSREEVARGR